MRKAHFMWQGWVNEILGTWLALAPLVRMDNASVKLNNLIIGVIAAVVSGYSPTKRIWECWLGLTAGAWLAFSSSFQVFVEGEGYLWNNIVFGVLIFTSGILVVASSSVQKHAINPLRGLKVNNQAHVGLHKSVKDRFQNSNEKVTT